MKSGIWPVATSCMRLLSLFSFWHQGEDVLFSNWEDHTHYGGNMKRRRQKLINIHTAEMTRQLLFGTPLTTKTWCHTFEWKQPVHHTHKTLTKKPKWISVLKIITQRWNLQALKSWARGNRKIQKWTKTESKWNKTNLWFTTF